MQTKKIKSALSKKPLNAYAKAAIKGCDWFVNSQTVQCRPYWDANHGRVPYNIHVPTGNVVQGLNWSMARATYCLLTAYARTADQKYLDCAQRAIDYTKTLQVMDHKDPNYGAFHEETPLSPYCYPRDAIETSGGMLALYSVTGEKDLLRRAELYLAWYLKKAFVKAGKWGRWAIPEVRFDGKEPGLTKFGAYQSGAGYILNYAYQLTGKSIYKNACLSYADSALKVYDSNGVGPWLEGDRQIYNDDGMGISILCAYKITGDKKYLKACQNVCDYFAVNDCTKGGHAGLCCIANFMVETDKAGGTNRYPKAIKSILKKVMATQVKHANKLFNGGFCGEDEPTIWYVKNSKSKEYVVTRNTAYSVLALFKAEGLAWGKGYSTAL